MNYENNCISIDLSDFNINLKGNMTLSKKRKKAGSGYPQHWVYTLPRMAKGKRFWF